MTKFYVDVGGNYIGGFDGAQPPGGAVEVAAPPPIHASQKWDGAAWSVFIPPTKAEDAEQTFRSNPALLALGRIATGNDTLTEDGLVALVRSKLP